MPARARNKAVTEYYVVCKIPIWYTRERAELSVEIGNISFAADQIDSPLDMRLYQARLRHVPTLLTCAACVPGVIAGSPTFWISQKVKCL
jgi:hypothetical protein